MEVRLDRIIIGERFRKKFEAINELAQSIAKHGLIVPIVIDEAYNLVAGERRMRACKQLKLEHIPVVMLKDLGELEKKEIELEENIQRKDFTWQEEIDAKQMLHELKLQLHGAAMQGAKNEGKWSLVQTATALGESPGTLSMDLQLAKGIKVFPELKSEKNKTTAFKKLKRLQEQLLQEVLAFKLEKEAQVKLPNVINGNCIEELKKMKSSSVDLLLTDPPYAINIEKAHTFDRMTMKETGFSDGEVETFDLLDKTFPEIYRVMKNNTHGFIFFGIDKATTVKKLLEKHGFWVHPLPLIWDKGSGSYPGQGTTFVHSYEVFFHIMKGKRPLNGNSKDLFTIKRVSSTGQRHVNQKPTELLRDLIKLTTIPGEVVLDPFAGSGSTLVAARETSRMAIGIELNPIFYTGILRDLNLAKEEEMEDEG